MNTDAEFGRSKFWRNWNEVFPLIFRYKGSVLSTIWAQVLFGVIYSALVVCIHNYALEIPTFSMFFVSVLGMVIGLLLVFRTTTGYERYWEGRKLWSTLTFRIRMMSFSVWLGCVPKDICTPEENMAQKRSAINLLIAFAYATKNYLREDFSPEDVDILDLTSSHHKFTNTQQHPARRDKTVRFPSTPPESRPSSGKSVTISLPESTTTPLHEKLNQAKKSFYSRKKSKQVITMSTRRRIAAVTSKIKKEDNPIIERDVYHAHDYVPPTNIPLELLGYFLTFVYKVSEQNRVDGTTGQILLVSINELANCLTNLERILRTPIPMAYSIHVHQCIWLYILFLPFQVVAQLGWLSVPGMLLACTYLFGILAIGWEIENPFGYDDNDLPLDDFCDVLREEIEQFILRKYADDEEEKVTDTGKDEKNEIKVKVHHLYLEVPDYNEDQKNSDCNNPIYFSSDDNNEDIIVAAVPFDGDSNKMQR